MKKILVLLVIIFIANTVEARLIMVSSASGINGKKWIAGDTLVMKSGQWINQEISLRAEGSSENPVVLKAETPGEVILTGTSVLSFSGDHIIIDGLYFKDGNVTGEDVISFRTSSDRFADNSRLTNITIVNYNPPDFMSENKWVSIYGKNNRVDHCTFINKTNQGTLLVVWLENGVIPEHIIDHNYFGYRNANRDSTGDEINGQEIIRIGDSKTSMLDARVIVSDNFFERCNGEVEIISNKSCENLYTNNVFYECTGMLTLRHGNRCTVDGNYFFGNGISNSGGVRIIGEDHKVYNNYFEKLGGEKYRAAICMVRGLENSPINGYFQVKNAVVAFNTMVDCNQSFSINYNTRDTATLPPIGSIIEYNLVYNSSPDKTNVIIYRLRDENPEISWKNNYMNQGEYSEISFSPSEVKTGIDPGMVSTGTGIEIYEPAAGSALAKYSTNEYPGVLTDIRGRNRGNAKIPGASQLSGTVTREMPTRSNTGSDYFNK